jgi:hypothetical protein
MNCVFLRRIGVFSTVINFYFILKLEKKPLICYDILIENWKKFFVIIIIIIMQIIGLVLFPSSSEEDARKTTTVHHSPVTLFPSKFPRKDFEYAMSIQNDFNLLIYLISQDYGFLRECLKKYLIYFHHW